MIKTIEDWNEAPLDVALSSGSAVSAALDWERMLFRDDDADWPGPILKRKLGGGPELKAFAEEDRAALTEKLGVYCRLQSMHSEDAVTWNWFGPLITADEQARAASLNWLIDTAADDTFVPPSDHVVIDMWRRIPDAIGAGGGRPELDVFLVSDKAVVLGEAKWRAGQDVDQGVAKNETQMEKRRQWLLKFAPTEHAGCARLLLGLYRGKPVEETLSRDDNGVLTRQLRWSKLAECPHHPRREEFARYLAWKDKHSQQ